MAVAQADGSDVHLLGEGGGGPSWSPDGGRIAFLGGPAKSTRLTLIRPDGTGRESVPTGGLAVGEPVWRVPAPLPSDRRPCVVRGNARANVIRGTPRGDLIYGGGGSDRIYGGGGTDTILGGGGPDRLYASAGGDTLAGNSGTDRLFGERGGDVFYGTDGARDFVFGGPGRDIGYFDRIDRLSSIEVRHYRKR